MTHLRSLLNASLLLMIVALSPMGAGASEAAHPAATVASPNGRLRVAIDADGDGRVSYSIARDEAPLIAASRLGFIFADAPKFERRLAVAGHSMRSSDATWEQPWGERRYVRDHFNELRVVLSETAAPHRRLNVVFRLFDDAVAFRYEFPQQPGFTQVNISEEQTEFAVAVPATAWWTPAGEWNSYEYLYHTTPLAEVSQAHTPLTIRTSSGVHIAFHEAALIDYAGMWLRRVDGQTLKVVLAPSGAGPKVSREAPFVSPWRTMLVTDTASGLIAAADNFLNLNEPNVLGDVSWVKPSKYVGIWWGMHLGTQTWGTGPAHGATTANTLRMIDFAAKNKFRGVLVEGWNEGWDGEWYLNGDLFSFTRPYKDFDLEKITSYAARKGVRLIGHHETAGNVARYESQLEAALDLYQKVGVDAVKTGYVMDEGSLKARAPDGSIQYTWHDSQLMSRHYLRVVTEAAKRRIMINTHEPIKDTGLRRTYPNWVSREGARGMEFNAWGVPPNPPEHESILVFTRLLSGPMDFTPGVLSLKGQGGLPLRSTLAKQLALYVVLYSPIQMAADLPENYARYPQAFQFIRDVPTDWNDTRAIAGEVGDYVTLARQDRNSEDWYLGSVSDERERSINVPLTFLGENRRYRAQIYRDADNASWEHNPHAIVIESREVKREDTLTFKLASGGGLAIRFVPH